MQWDRTPLGPTASKNIANALDRVAYKIWRKCHAPLRSVRTTIEPPLSDFELQLQNMTVPSRLSMAPDWSGKRSDQVRANGQVRQHSKYGTYNKADSGHVTS